MTENPMCFYAFQTCTIKAQYNCIILPKTLSLVFFFFFFFRSESKMWSPLVSEEGKTNPYKMNLANTETQVGFSPG